MSARTIEISRALAQGATALTQLVGLFKLNRRAVQREDGSSIKRNQADWAPRPGPEGDRAAAA